jgi:phytoene dehydrogenase-like protein
MFIIRAPIYDIGRMTDQMTREVKRKGSKVILLGAGLGGLAAAAFLAKVGL